MNVSLNQHNENIFWFDLCPNGEPEFISVYLIIDEKVALIETGPACSHSNLVEGILSAGINLSDIDYIIPTHIHLDHFGGGGHIMEICENAKAIVHPKAFKHVSKTEKWWEGSRDFLGNVAELYGKPKSILESRLIAADENYQLSLGKNSIEALHTPGHAPHHITWIYGDDAFVGDSAGLWYSELDKAYPVTPGYYRHDLALKSLDSMDSLSLKYIFYTHFGPRAVADVFSQTKKEFELWMKTVEYGFTNSLSSSEILEILFENRPGLLESDKKHGIHQRSTHLGTVEGMMWWLRRENETG